MPDPNPAVAPPSAPATAHETAAHNTTPSHAPRTPHDPVALLRSAEAPDELGRLGPFRVLRLLGTGGMGAVFAAEDTLLKRAIALKVMRPELTARPEARERFVREAQAAAAVESDYIVPVHQVGEDNGVLFIAMPLLKGETLEDRLRRDGRLSVPTVLKVAREVAEALSAAHGAGLVHRDIKPANLWLEGGATDGPHGFRRVRVLDFGLARPVGDAHLTGNAIVGTPAYMSPEQANGLPVDARTDLFSLGCVLYQSLAGRLPFRGPTTLAVLSALANATPPPVAEENPEVPTALGELVSRLLAKDPAARPESAAAVAATVDALRAELTAVTVELPAPKRPRRRWGVAAGALLAGALAVLAGVIVVKVKGPDGKETEVTVPEGSKIAVDAKGNVTVQLPPSAAKALALAPMPRQVDPDELECVLKKGESHTRGFVVLPDSNTVVAGYADGTLRVWDIATRTVVREHETRDPVRCMALHPNGTTVAVHTESGAVFEWSATTAKVLRRYTSWFFGPTAYSWAIAYAQAGATIVTTDNRSGTILCWDTATGRARVLTRLPSGASYGFVSVSPSGTEVAVLANNAPPRVLKLPGGEVVWEGEAAGGAAAAAFLPAGRGLVAPCVALSGGFPIGAWELAHACPSTMYFTSNSSTPYGLAVCPKGELLAAVGSNYPDVRVWRLGGEPTPRWTWSGPARTSAAYRAAFTANGTRLVTCHDRGTICVFRVTPNWTAPRKPYPALAPEWLAHVRQLSPEEQVKAVAAELVRRNPGFDGTLAPHIANGSVWALDVITDTVEDLTPIRAFSNLTHLGATGKTSMGRLWDLRPLIGLKLRGLGVQMNPVWDLRPLKGMPFDYLHLDSTWVSDLTPLAGMPLVHLSLTNCPVRDLAPVKGKRFDVLFLHNCNRITDLSLLRGSTIRALTLPPHYTGDLGVLTALSTEEVSVINPAFRFTPEQRKALDGVKTLKTINGKPVAEYWKAIDAEPPKKP